MRNAFLIPPTPPLNASPIVQSSLLFGWLTDSSSTKKNESPCTVCIFYKYPFSAVNSKFIFRATHYDSYKKGLSLVLLYIK